MLNREPTTEEILEQNGRRIVRRAVAPEGALQDAIMEVAMRDKMHWSHAELDELNAELDRCNDSIRLWMQTRELV